MTIFDNWTEETPLKEAISQAIGAASGCCGNLDGAGVYDSERTIVIVDELTEFVIDCIDRAFLTICDHMDEDSVNPQEPHLGLATTEELFRELIARFSLYSLTNNMGVMPMVDRALTLAEMLGSLSGQDKDYRTVDSH